MNSSSTFYWVLLTIFSALFVPVIAWILRNAGIKLDDSAIFIATIMYFVGSQIVYSLTSISNTLKGKYW